MKARIFSLALLMACLATDAFAADDKSKANPPPAAPAPAPAAKAGKAPEQKDSAAKAPAKAGESPTILAPVEVRRNRLIEHDRQILDLQDDIEREKKKVKATETDKALNDPKVSSALSVFGGSSSKSREELAKERLSLMETELTFLEMMDRVRTKAERDELQTQANEIRAIRRNLERGGSQPDSGR